METLIHRIAFASLVEAVRIAAYRGSRSPSPKRKVGQLTIEVGL
jgi:hypothetical protein